ncbi:MAG: cation:proton antiporter [Gemmatimonadota bacterium]|nr:cation:proton antiporter [Gemmatimonadota bacterium]
MDLWKTIVDILILLAVAMLLGGVAGRLKQSPLLGYLLAGSLLGPNALNLVRSHDAVMTVAELGVALLLFTIGLEFSWRRLRAVGPIALGGGTLQVLVTGAVASGVSLLAGLDIRAAIAIGAMIALSSTAAVIRLLANRAEIDAIHGRNAVGILLLQDIAVVPLTLIVAALSGGGSVAAIGVALARAAGVAALVVGTLHVLLNYLLPLLFSANVAGRNRDLPILIAIVTAVGAATLSHALGFSPVLGAFIAGLLLAESPYATQIRADVVPLQTLFVTLFFSSIGMLGNPAWVAENWLLLAAVVVAIVLGKAAITAGIVSLFKSPIGPSVATGLVLAQVGEFSLVIAVLAQGGEIIGAHLFDLVLAALTITLFLTPFLVALAPRLATAVGSRSGTAVSPLTTAEHAARMSGHLVIVGFGPAGQRVGESLLGESGLKILVVDMNPENADVARAYGLETHVGDVMREEMLERVHIRTAAAVAVTVPDPRTARHIVQRVRSAVPDAIVAVRSRYHVHRWQLEVAGAHAVIDEEDQVGIAMAEELRERLRAPHPNEPRETV